MSIKSTKTARRPGVGCRALVRLLSPIRAAAGNILLPAGSIVTIVEESDSGDEWCVEHTDDIGGWPGERNRRWIFKRRTEEANDQAHL